MRVEPTSNVQTTPPVPISTTQKAPEERRALLAQAVTRQLALGNRRIESQSDYNAVLVYGRRANHILHLILSVLTLGLWLIIWLIIGLSSGERREIITVDEFGNTSIQFV